MNTNNKNKIIKSLSVNHLANVRKLVLGAVLSFLALKLSRQSPFYPLSTRLIQRLIHHSVLLMINQRSALQRQSCKQATTLMNFLKMGFVDLTAYNLTFMLGY